MDVHDSGAPPSDTAESAAGSEIVDGAGSEARRRAVRAAVAQWKSQLVDLGARNTLLFFKDLRAGTLDLSPASPANQVAISSLLEDRGVRLSNVFADPDDLSRAAKRCRTMVAKAKVNFEERGLETLYVGWGIATWANATGSATPAAPVLLRRLLLRARGGAAEDFDMQLADEWEVNPTLAHKLREDFTVAVTSDELLGLLAESTVGAPDPEALFERLVKEAARSVPGFRVEPRLVVANFSYAKLPMVLDIESAADEGLIDDHELLAAIAGNASAAAAVRARHASVSASLPDSIPPADEFLVLDADASQSWAINSVVAGSDLVIDGPPGTGKSQTIANLIATMAARGLRVLFVAEKRAAIDAVLDRLNRVGLGDLVLDLHDGVGSKRQLAQDLAKALHSAGTLPLPNVASVHRELAARRATLVQRTDALHRIRDPWGVSVFDIQAELLGQPAAVASDLRFRGDVLSDLGAEALADAADELSEWVDLGGGRLDATSSAWGAAFEQSTITSDSQAAEALDGVRAAMTRTLPNAHERLRKLLADCALREPESVEGWAPLLSLLDDVGATLAVFDAAVWDLDLPALCALLQAPADSRAKASQRRVTSGTYRKARKTLRRLWLTGRPTTAELFTAASAARDQSARWSELALDDGAPRMPEDLPGTEGAYEQLNLELRAVGAWTAATSLDGQGPDELTTRLRTLTEDQATLFKLPRLHELTQSLRGRGLDELVAQVRLRALDAAGARALLRNVWLESILEELSATDRAIGTFDGQAHSRAAEAFRTADREHVIRGADRVRRAVAEWATRMRDEHPEQSQIVEHQSRRMRGHMPVRQLFHEAPNVLGALKPCWAMSPLVVAQLLPAERCFDIVVFDEASQVTPADAVCALLRAERAVVAGDPRQLPPTSFFTSTASDDDHEDDDSEALALTSGLESVLDVMGALLPPPVGTKTLNWHYRSRDERLIAFSNAQPSLYDWSLVTFPGVVGEDAVSHILVDGPAGIAGQEQSVAAEVERVVELIVEHARSRPSESLGVIAMGIKHAERIAEGLRRCRAELPELDAFFDLGPERPDGTRDEPLFIKNLERVQGDERDAIILTIGYGKSTDGRMLYRFGPLNLDGGERRLNVAVTRARRRITAVSSFSSTDMDPNRLNKEGARMLRRYLAYAESGGTDLGEASRPTIDLNPFERDVRDELIKAGIPLVCQLGVAGYWIDFAAQHPRRRGQMVLAIEADGATYHSSHTARDRDRLRQDHLENLGWRFHRIWSTDWFRDRELEVGKAVTAWQEACADADVSRNTAAGSGDERASGEPSSQASGPEIARPTPARGRARPRLVAGHTIDSYSHDELVELVRWVRSDTLLRTSDQILAEVMTELGFNRRGARIVAAISAAIEAARE